MRRLTVVSIVAVFLVAVAGPALASYDIEGQVASRLQSLDGDTGNAKNLEAGFNDALFNLQVYGDVASGVSAFVEVENNASDTNTLSGFSDEKGLGVTEAYITLSDLTPTADLKMGYFDVDFGNQHLRNSSNANVQGNNLIGNYLVDPVSAQKGLELSGTYQRVAWRLALTNGGNEFEQDHGIGKTAKIWGPVMPGLKAAFSWYSVDHSDADTAVKSNLFASNGSSATAYGSLSGEGVTVDPLSGKFDGREVSAMQLDLTYDLAAQGMPAEFYAFYGEAEDSEKNDEDEGSYWGLEVSYDLTPASYFAARYNVLTVDKDNGNPLNNNNEANRIQVAVGHELAPNTLAKLEYVTQETEWNNNDEFGGVIGELSVSF